MAKKKSNRVLTIGMTVLVIFFIFAMVDGCLHPETPEEKKVAWLKYMASRRAKGKLTVEEDALFLAISGRRLVEERERKRLQRQNDPHARLLSEARQYLISGEISPRLKIESAARARKDKREKIQAEKDFQKWQEQERQKEHIARTAELKEQREQQRMEAEYYQKAEAELEKWLREH